MNNKDIKLMSESYNLVKEHGMGGNVSNTTKDIGSIPVGPKPTAAVTVAKTNPQDESIQTVMRAWRITPTPDNIQKVRTFLGGLRVQSDKAPEDFGAPMHEME